MYGTSDEAERTLRFAQMALDQIRALEQAATPPNYELWYHYVAGYNPSLNRAVNETLARVGVLSEADLDKIYTAYFSPSQFADRIHQVNTKVVGEMDQVMAMIHTAVNSTSSFSETLDDASRQLGHTTTPEALGVIIETLVHNTLSMKESNEALEGRLTASRQEITVLQANLETVRAESLTDPLTSLSNRKYFDQAFAKAITDGFANKEPVSLLLADIDHFKIFNDTYGHPTGDQVLRLVAMTVRQIVKGQDIAARFGGEEFAVVLPNTVLQSAIMVADHIRRAVMTKELTKRSTGECLGRVTVSVGVATLRPGDTMDSLIERADACLYAAKRTGRNRVISETDPEIIQPPTSISRHSLSKEAGGARIELSG